MSKHKRPTTRTKKGQHKYKIVYIIPTYNEKDNITDMLRYVHKILAGLKKYKFNILVVDDSSPDGTGELVKKFIKSHRRVVLLSGKKQGLGMAMSRGYKFAINNLKADFVISNESDFSYDPSETKRMLRIIEDGYDAVFGSRKLENLNSWPISRRFIHFVANTIFATFVAGITQVEDHNSAFKAIRVKGVLEKMNFDKFPKGFSFFNYLTYKISCFTPRICEFKTTFRPRTKGVSKMMMKDSIEYIKNCFAIRFEKIKSLFS